MANLIIEGQEHEIDDAFVNLGATVEESDQLLRNALRGSFDIIANATFRREVKDGALTITVIKNPGTKGNDRLVSVLLDAPEYVNPAYMLDCQLRMQEVQAPLDLPTLLGLQTRIREALKAGRAIDVDARKVHQSLLRAAPTSSACVPLGF
jgi:hypothetical protein